MLPVNNLIQIQTQNPLVTLHSHLCSAERVDMRLNTFCVTALSEVHDDALSVTRLGCL